MKKKPRWWWLYVCCTVSIFVTCKDSVSVTAYTIRATATEHGTITPCGTVTVEPDTDITFTITPDKLFRIADIMVDNVSIGAKSTYTFAGVTQNHTIHAVFEAIPYTVITPRDSNIIYTGRFDFSDSHAAAFAWPGVSIQARFSGQFCALKLKQNPYIPNHDQYSYNYYLAILDSDTSIIKATEDDSVFIVGENLDDTIHTITIFKRTESFCGRGIFSGFILEYGSFLLDPPPSPIRRIECIGNSITCGYGNEGNPEIENIFKGSTENNYMAYGAITARACSASYTAVCFSGKGVYMNSDGSLDETLPDLYNRIDPYDSSSLWDFSHQQPDVVIINLGINDFSRTIPDSALFVNRYISFVKIIYSHYPHATLFCINGPMRGNVMIHPVSQEQKYAVEFCARFIEAAVVGIKESGFENIYTYSLSRINESDGFGVLHHPNVTQHKRNAAELTHFVKTKMGWE